MSLSFKFFLFVMFFSYSNFVFGEWKQVVENSEVIFYVELGSVRLIDDGIKSVWVLKNQKKPKKNLGSRQLKLEMDCEQDEMRISSRYTYSGKSLSGLPIKDYFKTEEWRSIKTDNELMAVHNLICKKNSK